MSKLFEREIQPELLRLTESYPVITVTGPRQSGKTTLVKNVYPHKAYVNLEEPDVREIIRNDPRAFFSDKKEGAILDEIQRAPELMSYIQSIVDEKQIAGMFVLTGSHQLQLHQAITQSLAGRAAILNLLPLTINEIRKNDISMQVNEYLFNGFYPAVYQKKIDPMTIYRNYISTYVERDVRQLVNVKDLNNFQRFMQLLASRVGSVLNINSLADDVGNAPNTIKNWLSILETSFLLYRLPPYFENFGKRIIKSSKIYFIDVGIVSYLLGIETEKQISRERLKGGLFENLVLLELMKARINKGKSPYLYYYRDQHSNEVDIIIKHRNFLIPVEVKSSSTFNSALLKNLHYYRKLVKTRAPLGFLVYSGDMEQNIDNIHVINYQNTSKIWQIIESIVD